MVSRDHYLSCRGVNYQRTIFGHTLGRYQLGPLVALERGICSLGPSKPVVAVWVPGWSRSGYRGGRVSEGQLMEIKEETIRDGKFGRHGGAVA
jgi:hypothetical protein